MAPIFVVMETLGFEKFYWEARKIPIVCRGTKITDATVVDTDDAIKRINMRYGFNRQSSITYYYILRIILTRVNIMIIGNV